MATKDLKLDVGVGFDNTCLTGKSVVVSEETLGVCGRRYGVRASSKLDDALVTLASAPAGGWDAQFESVSVIEYGLSGDKLQLSAGVVKGRHVSILTEDSPAGRELQNPLEGAMIRLHLLLGGSAYQRSCNAHQSAKVGLGYDVQSCAFFYHFNRVGHTDRERAVSALDGVTLSGLEVCHFKLVSASLRHRLADDPAGGTSPDWPLRGLQSLDGALRPLGGVLHDGDIGQHLIHWAFNRDSSFQFQISTPWGQTDSLSNTSIVVLRTGRIRDNFLGIRTMKTNLEEEDGILWAIKSNAC